MLSTTKEVQRKGSRAAGDWSFFRLKPLDRFNRWWVRLRAVSLRNILNPMKKRVIGLTALVVALLIFGFAASRFTGPPGSRTTAQQSPPVIGSLRWLAQDALANGENSVSVVANPHTGDATSMDEAIADESVVVADLLAQTPVYYEDQDTIITWSKFRTAETLKQVSFSCSDCSA